MNRAELQVVVIQLWQMNFQLGRRQSSGGQNKPAASSALTVSQSGKPLQCGDGSTQSGLQQLTSIEH